MSYPNAYLRDFVPVLGQILKEKQIAPEKLHLEIIDEESEEKSIFEPVCVDELLDQLADELNHLTVYTDRPAHFQAFAEQIYEENGLMPLIFTKKQLKSRSFSGAQVSKISLSKMLMNFSMKYLRFDCFHQIAPFTRLTPVT